MADVFISYSQKRGKETLALARALASRRYRPWYDIELGAGEAFGARIDKEIDRAKAVITLWTPEAGRSVYVPAESERALNQKKLICVRTPDTDPTELPTPFNRLNATEFRPDETGAIDAIERELNRLECWPAGAEAADMTPEDELRRSAEADWPRIQKSTDHDVIEAYIETYRRVPLYRQLAQGVLLELQAREGEAAARDWETASRSSDPGRVFGFLETYSHLPRFVRLATDRLKQLDASAAQQRRAAAILANLDDHEIYLRPSPEMHTAAVKRISLTADGTRLASASEDKTVKLWALPEGRLIRTFRPPIGAGNEGKVYAVAIAPDGHWVAAGGWMGVNENGQTFVTVFDTDDGAVRARLGPLPNVVHDLDISPDGTRLAAGLGGTNGIRLWETAGWRQMGKNAEYEADYDGRVCGLAFSTDGRFASTSYDGHVRLYDPDGQLIAKVRTPGGDRPFGVAFCPDGARLAVGYSDSLNLDVLDAASLELLYSAETADLSGGNLCSAAWIGGADADLRLAAGGLSGGERSERLFTWEAARHGPRRAWPGPTDVIMDLAPTPDGGLALASFEPTLALYDADGTRTLNKKPEIADVRGVQGEHFTVSADGLRLRFGLGYSGRTPALFDLVDLTLSDAPEAPPSLAAPETESLTIIGWVNTSEPFLLRQGTPTPLTLEPYEIARSLAIAPDAGSFVLGADWSLRRFDAAGSELWQRPVPGVCWGVNLAREGRLILAAYGDGTIRWHRADNGEELLALFIHLPDGPKDTAPDKRAWILYTPEGYYTASSEDAEDLIGWHVNRGPDEAADFYPAETFAETFRRKDKVAAALDGI